MKLLEFNGDFKILKKLGYGFTRQPSMSYRKGLIYEYILIRKSHRIIEAYGSNIERCELIPLLNFGLKHKNHIKNSEGGNREHLTLLYDKKNNEFIFDEGQSVVEMAQYFKSELKLEDFQYSVSKHIPIILIQNLIELKELDLLSEGEYR